MNTKDQLISSELELELIELGFIPIEIICNSYIINSFRIDQLLTYIPHEIEILNKFSRVMEVSKLSMSKSEKGEFVIKYKKSDICFMDKNCSNAIAMMLIYLIKNEIIKLNFDSKYE